MKGRNRNLLGLASLVLLTLLLFILTREEASEEPGLLFDGLSASLDDVVRVVLNSPTSDVTRISRGGAGQTGEWNVEGKAGYPADFEKLHGLLTGLASARLVEPKTSRAEHHGRLGLATEGSGDETGTRVRVELADGGSFEAMIGKASRNRDGTFVRRVGEDQTWLVDESLSAAAEGGQWIDPIIINVDSSSIAKVEMRSSTRELLVGERNEDEGITVKNLPVDATLKYGTVGDTLGRALVNVRLEDVEPLDEPAWTLHNRARFSRNNGDVILADTMMDGDRRLLRLSLELGEGSDLARFKVKEDWQFEISDYAYDALTKTMDDMVEREAPATSDDAGPP